MLDTIKRRNEALEIFPVWSEKLDRYGRVVMCDVLGKAAELVVQQAEKPESGTFYTPQADFLCDQEMKDEISNQFFGGLPVEIGYCIGHNNNLNALEYHKCNEVLAFNGDVVIFLGRMEDVDMLGGIYRMSQLEGFFVPSGTQIELYPGTLHYGAMETSKAGFSFVVCLLEGTNTPLAAKPDGRENEMLIQKNKWVICTSEAKDEIVCGAPVWITDAGIYLCPADRED